MSTARRREFARTKEREKEKKEKKKQRCGEMILAIWNNDECCDDHDDDHDDHDDDDGLPFT